MILPVHALVRARLAGRPRRARSASRRPISPRSCIETPPRRALGDLAVPVAFELARRLRKAPARSRRSSPAALGAIDGVARVEAAPNGYLNFFLDRAAFLRGAAEPAPRPRRRRRRRQGHRRAHGDQPEQGRAHRPPAQRGARRHARAAAPLPGPRRSRCRTTSTTPACRSPTSSSASPSSRARDLDGGPARSPTTRRRASTTTAGISTRASPSGTRRTRRGSRSRAHALHAIEAGGNAARGDGRLHRRPHRPLPPARRWRG